MLIKEKLNSQYFVRIPSLSFSLIYCHLDSERWVLNITDLWFVKLTSVRCWSNHRCWSLYSCWNSCQRAHWTVSHYFLLYWWISGCSFCILLCRACVSLPICWKCISLLICLHWRRVKKKFLIMWNLCISLLHILIGGNENNRKGNLFRVCCIVNPENQSLWFLSIIGYFSL